MVRHIVMFWLRDNSPENIIIARDKLRSLSGKIEGLLSCEVELDALRSDRSCDLCLNMLFASQEALDAYRTHPEHIPVQKHMHAVRSGSHAADYPVSSPTRQMPALFAMVNAASATADAFAALLASGMRGVLLSYAPEHAHCVPTAESALREAKGRAGCDAELILHPLDNALPQDMDRIAPDGIAMRLPNDLSAIQSIRAELGSRALIAIVDTMQDMDKLPTLLSHADQVLFMRDALSASAPAQNIATLQSTAAFAAVSRGKRLILSGGVLDTMASQPTPALAEHADIHAAIASGITGLALTDAAQGRYAAQAMSALADAARAAVCAP